MLRLDPALRTFVIDDRILAPNYELNRSKERETWIEALSQITLVSGVLDYRFGADARPYFGVME